MGIRMIRRKAATIITTSTIARFDARVHNDVGAFAVGRVWVSERATTLGLEAVSVGGTKRCQGQR